MSDLERNAVYFVSMWNDRHPRMTLALALLFFLAGLLLCAGLV